MWKFSFSYFENIMNLISHLLIVLDFSWIHFGCFLVVFKVAGCVDLLTENKSALWFPLILLIFILDLCFEEGTNNFNFCGGFYYGNVKWEIILYGYYPWACMCAWVFIIDVFLGFFCFCEIVTKLLQLQANTPDELPERLIGAVRVSHLELKSATVPNLGPDPSWQTKSFILFFHTKLFVCNMLFVPFFPFYWDVGHCFPIVFSMKY